MPITEEAKSEIYDQLSDSIWHDYMFRSWGITTSCNVESPYIAIMRKRLMEWELKNDCGALTAISYQQCLTTHIMATPCTEPGDEEEFPGNLQ